MSDRTRRDEARPLDPRARPRTVARPFLREPSTGRRTLLALAALSAAFVAALALASMPAARAAGTSDAAVPEGAATATFGGGCFWCMEPPFDETEGVYSTTSGYTGGEVDDPSYEQVSAGGTGHVEVVQVTYDPETVDYATLLDVFWRNVDPLTANRQFCDGGPQYRSAIFVHDEHQRELADASLAALEASGRFEQPIVTEIVDAATFWPAEDYHQDYYEKNPIRYKLYRTACGRDRRLEEVWGDVS